MVRTATLVASGWTRSTRKATAEATIASTCHRRTATSTSLHARSRAVALLHVSRAFHQREDHSTYGQMANLTAGIASSAGSAAAAEAESWAVSLHVT